MAAGALDQRECRECQARRGCLRNEDEQIVTLTKQSSLVKLAVLQLLAVTCSRTQTVLSCLLFSQCLTAARHRHWVHNGTEGNSSENKEAAEKEEKHHDTDSKDQGDSKAPDKEGKAPDKEGKKDKEGTEESNEHNKTEADAADAADGGCGLVVASPVIIIP